MIRMNPPDPTTLRMDPTMSLSEHVRMVEEAMEEYSRRMNIDYETSTHLKASTLLKTIPDEGELAELKRECLAKLARDPYAWDMTYEIVLDRLLDTYYTEEDGGNDAEEEIAQENEVPPPEGQGERQEVIEIESDSDDEVVITGVLPGVKKEWYRMDSRMYRNR